MNVYLDACKRHLEDAKVHMEKGKSLYQAEHSEEHGEGVLRVLERIVFWGFWGFL